MDSTPLYIIIGSISGIVAIVASFVLIISQFPKVVRTIHSGLVKLYRWLRERPTVFSRWRWWRQYRPSCEIVKVGELEITGIHDHYFFKYQMQLEIDVKYTSKDFRYPTEMNSYNISIDVLHAGQGRDKTPYNLGRSDLLRKVAPLDENEEGGYSVIPYEWRLPSNEYSIIRYRLRGQEQGEPLLGDSTFFKVLAIGESWVEKVGQEKKLKMSDKYPVKVVKKYDK